MRRALATATATDRRSAQQCLSLVTKMQSPGDQACYFARSPHAGEPTTKIVERLHEWCRLTLPTDERLSGTSCRQPALGLSRGRVIWQAGKMLRCASASARC